MGKEKESFILYDQNIKRRERRSRYDLYMKNKPVTRVFQGKEVIYPALTGSNTPTSKCGGSKEVRWEYYCP
ncbi:hypothetical protein [Bacillus pseudomycoides]|uniref:hypothetical protein n=1 Tax=Bacillus pseudomycoides TaxID=64104 RepID=UPI000BF1D715|nr:hypothetical protein [Bacillus pseudomycoides]PEM63994.1 hypothetical protein CN619_28310 [Bacillus pseudomycoides]PGA62145.1 hypothetical protein COL84_13950 [Bacillus pseudomycoides]PHA41511.1 hypothetical protein COE73_28370 [Bacillus pseudomycoides]PHA52908.1 hypothetical protein COE76_23705 [Bacillus pseudomycoides]